MSVKRELLNLAAGCAMTSEVVLTSTGAVITSADGIRLELTPELVTITFVPEDSDAR